VRGIKKPGNQNTAVSCPKKGRFLRALMGELGPREMRNFDEHVLQCSKCRFLLEALRRLQTELEARKKAVAAEKICAKDSRDLKRLARRQIKALTPKKAFSLSRPVIVGGAVLAAAAFLFLGDVFLIRTHARDQLHRGSSKEGLRLIEPRGNLEEAPSVFLWTDVKGRDVFSVKIVDDELNLLYGDNVNSTRLSLPPEVERKFAKGRVYLWTVEARDDSRAVLASASGYFSIE
jgi:hypothetical protein